VDPLACISLSQLSQSPGLGIILVNEQILNLSFLEIKLLERKDFPFEDCKQQTVHNEEKEKEEKLCCNREKGVDS
jgi:hypothetical protein